MPYQVVWSRCNVFDNDGGVSTLSRGEYVPEAIDDTQKSQLATIGAVRFVDVGLPALAELVTEVQSAPISSDSEPDNPEEPPVGLVLPTSPDAPAPVTVGEPPSRSATKPEWEDYAVSRGMPRQEAEEATKTVLVARFGG